MLTPSSFLDKFNSLQNPGDDKNKIISTIVDLVGVSLSPKEITIRNKVLFVKTSSVIKNELFLRKEEIINQIQDRLNILITDIK